MPRKNGNNNTAVKIARAKQRSEHSNSKPLKSFLLFGLMLSGRVIAEANKVTENPLVSTSTGRRLSSKPSILSPQSHLPKPSFFSSATCQSTAFRDITNPLLERIGATDSADIFYKNYTSISFPADKRHFINAIKYISSSSQEFYCKLKTILQIPSFQVMFTADEKFMLKGVQGEHLSRNNHMYLPCNLQSRNMHDFLNVVIHELHHAWVAAVNTLFNRHPINNFAVSDACPFGTSKDDAAQYHGEFSSMLENGINKLIKLEKQLKKDNNKLSIDEQKDLAEFIKLSSGYKRQKLRSNISQDLVTSFINAKIVSYNKNKNKFKLLTKPQLACGRHNDIPCYPTDMKPNPSGEGAWFYYSFSKTSDAPHKALIADLLALKKMSLSVTESETINRDEEPLFEFSGVIELDTYITHTLLLYSPKLTDFLFPGLREWHYARADQDFRDCLMQPDYQNSDDDVVTLNTNISIEQDFSSNFYLNFLVTTQFIFFLGILLSYYYHSTMAICSDNSVNNTNTFRLY